jgi:zinc transport system substrate-binding protein
MNVNKRFVVAVLAIIALVIIAGVVFSYKTEKPTSKLKVSASVYPFAEITRQIGKNRIELTTITPPGVEPHDFEPSPRDLVKIRKTKVFVYSGAGFEPWADKTIADLHGVTVVDASKGIKLLPAIEHEHEAEESGGKAHEQESVTDPHYHLDPVLLQQSVDNVADALCRVDSANANFYKANAGQYKRQLTNLDKEYREGLSRCRQRDIVTGHAAFAYLAKRYGLRQIPIAGMSEEDPSPARLAEIVEYVKRNNIKYIFVEKLGNPRLSETIANEAGAKLLVLNPIEGLTDEDRKAGKDYVALMRDNLVNLKTALGCE